MSRFVPRPTDDDVAHNRTLRHVWATDAEWQAWDRYIKTQKDPYYVDAEYEHTMREAFCQPAHPESICFADSPDGNATCLLKDGHDGPHNFTDDSLIHVTFQ